MPAAGDFFLPASWEGERRGGGEREI